MSEPSLSSPSLAHCSVSQQLLWLSSPGRGAPAASRSVSRSVLLGRRGESAVGWGSAPTGRSRWSSCRKGPCPWLLGTGPAGFGVLPSSKGCSKAAFHQQVCEHGKKNLFFYSFSVRYTRLYIYIYTYIPLYIDIYRYTHIYYLRLSLLEALYVAVGFQR